MNREKYCVKWRRKCQCSGKLYLNSTYSGDIKSFRLLTKILEKGKINLQYSIKMY